MKILIWYQSLGYAYACLCACVHQHHAEPSMSSAAKSAPRVSVPPRPSTEDEPGSRSIVEGRCLWARDNVFSRRIEGQIGEVPIRRIERTTSGHVLSKGAKYPWLETAGTRPHLSMFRRWSHGSFPSVSTSSNLGLVPGSSCQYSMRTPYVIHHIGLYVLAMNLLVPDHEDEKSTFRL
ncbi:hypothetical protein CRG98_032656 [Punica granatum]|uniref:Uncharacterized protein n=1 Tax=Punica granatum TaxID=22663 RepID=A0A2I0ISH6_PUNGR|nr:hypothetical protein CRG98_032656 [Punica granatum]